jgi:hypothetical protein
LPVAVDEDVGGRDDVVDGLDLEAFHRRLQRADRIDLGDDHAAALAAQRLRAALADLAVAEDHRDLAAEHHVGGARQPSAASGGSRRCCRTCSWSPSR